jgi:TRAP-type C4-dicarboxylate transport system permease small subunit
MSDIFIGIVCIVFGIYSLQWSYKTWDQKGNDPAGIVAKPQIVIFAILGIIGGLLFIARGCNLVYQ